MVHSNAPLSTGSREQAEQLQFYTYSIRHHAGGNLADFPAVFFFIWL